MKFLRMFAPILAGTVLVGVAGSTAAAPTGQQVFEQRCMMCHSVKPEPGKMGPPLAGVVGRKAGTVGGYAYSNAMKASTIVWSAATLDPYLKAPGKTVPGTKMLLGAPDAEQRAAVIQYLGTLKK